MGSYDSDNYLPLPIHTSVEQEVAIVPDGTSFDDAARQVVKRNQLKKDFDESFLLGDLGILVDQFKRFRRELPRVEIFYAIKANSLRPVLRVMAALGCGFDAASKCEIDMVLKTGVGPDTIIYANPCKFASHIVHARENDVTMTVFDNEEELLKTKKLFPSSKLVMRIAADDSKARSKFSNKYGVGVDEGKALLVGAKKLDMDVIGISFHVGSGCPGVESFRKAIRDSRELFDFAEEIGYHFTLLDIGGGFPGSEEADRIRSFEEMASVIREGLEEHFPASSGVRIISEPGRYLPGTAFVLVTNVLAKRVDDGRVSYYIGDSVYNSFNAVLTEKFNAYPKPLENGKSTDKVNGSGAPCTIFGYSLDGSDVIARPDALPEMQVGDWVTWKDMGGYSAYVRMGFNGFTTHKACYYITESKLRELRDLCVHPEMLPPTRDEI